MLYHYYLLPLHYYINIQYTKVLKREMKTKLNLKNRKKMTLMDYVRRTGFESIEMELIAMDSMAGDALMKFYGSSKIDEAKQVVAERWKEYISEEEIQEALEWVLNEF